MHVGLRWARECTCTMSVIWSRRGSSAQHRHHRGDARARGEEQHRGRRRVGHDEVALRCGQPHDRAGCHAADQVGRQEALRHGLHGDGDGACAALVPTAAQRGRGQRIGPPAPAAVDQQADTDVLAGLVVEREAPARLDDQRRRVLGLAAHLDDPATQFTCRPQRVRELEVVVRQQRRRDAGGDGAQRMPTAVTIGPAMVGRTVSATLAETFISLLATQPTVP